jgi:hypothetical protein
MRITAIDACSRAPGGNLGGNLIRRPDASGTARAAGTRGQPPGRTRERSRRRRSPLRGSVGWRTTSARRFGLLRDMWELGALLAVAHASDSDFSSTRWDVLVLCSNHRATPVSRCSYGDHRSRPSWPGVVGCARCCSVLSPGGADSKSREAQTSCGFDPHLRHHLRNDLRRASLLPRTNRGGKTSDKRPSSQLDLAQPEPQTVRHPGRVTPEVPATITVVSHPHNSAMSRSPMPSPRRVRAPVRRRSCGIRPGRLAAPHALLNAAWQLRTGFPFRWNTHQMSLPCSRSNAVGRSRCLSSWALTSGMTPNGKITCSCALTVPRSSASPCPSRSPPAATGE